MQKLSLPSSSMTFFPLFPLFPLTSSPSRVELLFHNPCKCSIASSFRPLATPFNCSFSHRLVLPPLRRARNIILSCISVTEEIVETSEKNELEFIEVGIIYGIHGLGGELRVKPSTGFPELRFSKPGRRWLKERVSGKEVIQEVELVEGREHPGQRCWIVSFRGIDSADKAKELIGSTLLVCEDDRPVLEEGEFYTQDLVGMSVILKETSQPVGTVINVFNTGASDLLEVMLNSVDTRNDGTASSKSESGVSGPLVLVPFVKAIVPDIDMNKREMQITPPKGLLELNVHSDERSKKERRQLEWKQRKKATKRLIAAKKKLCEMDQKHVFDGLRFGEKAQRSLLADNIVGINFTLFKPALEVVETLSSRARFNLFDFIDANSTKLLENSFKISEKCLLPSGSKEMLDARKEFQENGLRIISEGKVATLLVLDDKTNHEKGFDLDLGNAGCIQNSSNISCLQALFCNDEQFIKIEHGISLPLVIISPSHEIQSIQKFFLDHDYFGFDTEKVWFLEEEELPVISSSREENAHKILMKSPWEILRAPVGSGGVFSIISSHGIVENLSEIGVDYLQVCSLDQKPVIGCPSLLGFVCSRDGDVGIHFNDEKNLEKDFDVIFSMRFLKKVTKQISKLQLLHAVPKQNSHVLLADKEWVDIVPSSPNSYELHCSIYSSLNACSCDKICVMEVTD